MARIPQLDIEVVITDDENLELFRKTVDIAEEVSRELKARPRSAEAWMRGESVYLHLLSDKVTQTAVSRLRSGKARVAVPGFGNKVSAFIEKVGGVQAVANLHKLHEGVRSAKTRLEEAKKQVETVRKATCRMDCAGYVMVFSDHISRNEGYVQVEDLQGAFDFHRYDEYAAILPKPDLETPEHNAWWAQYRRWVDHVAPPFVFATNPIVWNGMDPDDLRQDVLEAKDCGEDYDVYQAVHDRVSDEHWEGAYEEVVDLADLSAIIEEWLPHAGTGSAEDKALESKVAAWNAKQNLVSYMVDPAVVVALKGATQADIIAWCESEVERRKRELHEARNAWNRAHHLTDGHLRICLHDLNRAGLYTEDLEQVRDVLAQNTDLVDRVLDYTPNAAGTHGLDTADRDILLDTLARKYVGRCWPVNMEGSASSQAFHGWLSNAVVANGWTLEPAATSPRP